MRGRNATLPVDGLCYGINDRGDDNNRVCDADDEVSTYTMQIGDTYTLVEVPLYLNTSVPIALQTWHCPAARYFRVQ